MDGDLAPDPAAIYAAVGTHGDARRVALDTARDALDDVVALVTDALEAGADLNLTEIARRAGVAKATIYNRVPDELIAGRRDAEPAA